MVTHSSRAVRLAGTSHKSGRATTENEAQTDEEKLWTVTVAWEGGGGSLGVPQVLL